MFPEHIDQDGIDINDYVLHPEEEQMQPYVDMLNIFTIYYRQLFAKQNNTTLLDDIDGTNPASTNRQLELFYEGIHKYKNRISDDEIELYTLSDYKKKYKIIPNDVTAIYIVQVNNVKKITHSIISAIMFVSKHDWMTETCEWSIQQINAYD